MKYLFLLPFLLVLNAHAELACYEKLTGGLGDSAVFRQFSGDVYSNGMEILDEQMALNAVNKTLKDLQCEKRLELEHMKCEEAVNTTICRINFSMGYFLILKDYVDTVNVIFNRWD
jgi:hypothetical protein